MLRMEFTGHSVDAPLPSETARRFNVNNNIISAQMDYAGGGEVRHHAHRNARYTGRHSGGHRLVAGNIM